MSVIPKHQEKQENQKTNEIEYDETLTSLLVENGFNRQNINNLVPTTRFYSNAKEIPTIINSIRINFKGGCIFKLPSGKRNNMFFIYHTTATPEEIRRRLKLKAFL